MRNLSYAGAVLVLIVALPLAVWLDMRQLSETSLQQQAQSLSRVVGLVRDFYTKEVVRRIVENDGAATFSHLYHDVPGGIPVPATFSIELAQSIRKDVANLDYRFVSDLPFAHREEHNLDAFEKMALASFRAGRREDAIKFSGDLLSRQVALAVPVIMQQGCVDCHNAHPSSPRHDWVVGDVRGIQVFSVARPIALSLESFRYLSTYLLILVTAGGVFILGQNRQSKILNASNLELSKLNTEIGTARRQLTEAIESISEGFSLYDSEDRLVVSNSRYRDLLYPGIDDVAVAGARFEQIIRQAVDRGLIADAQTDPENWISKRLVQHKTPGEPHIQRRSDDRWIRISERLTGEGGIVAVYSDISELKWAEGELREAKDRAERAYHELEAANASLIQAEKMASLGGLVAGIAHEINTPVGVTLTAASHLAETVETIEESFSAGQLKRSDFEDYISLSAETMKIIVANLNRAADLIQSFKQVAVDQTSEEWRRFDLGDYIGEILLSLGPSLKGAAHQIDVDCPPGFEVAGYPGALSQILTNLLINSMTHAYDPGEVGEIQISAQETPQGKVNLRYSDDGKGIERANQSKIFDPFFTTRRGSGGSGLGLNLVYNLVTQSMDGSISVESEPGRGTSFVIEFPKIILNQEKMSAPIH